MVAWLLGACAAGSTPGAPTSPTRERPPGWIELTSEHFTVWTDSTPAQARALVRTMEHLRQVILGVSFFKASSNARSIVIAFRSRDELRTYLPPQFQAHAWSARNPLLQPVIVLSIDALEGDRRLVTHELTHVVAFNVIPDQPRWFAEGVAGYFETVRLDEARATVEVGRPLEFRMRALHGKRPVPSATLFACDQPACMDDCFYATTWALVTYLINAYPSEMTRYMRRLREVPPADQPKLWAEVFPKLPPATLDRELAHWIAHGRINVLNYRAALRDWPVTQAPLEDAQVLAARGLIRFLFKHDAVPTEVTAALTLDANNVVASFIKAMVERTIAPERAQAIAAAAPEDWRAWVLVGMANPRGQEASEARAKTCTLLAKNPVAIPPEVCSPGTAPGGQDPR